MANALLTLSKLYAGILVEFIKSFKNQLSIGGQRLVDGEVDNCPRPDMSVTSCGCTRLDFPPEPFIDLTFRIACWSSKTGGQVTLFRKTVAQKHTAIRMQIGECKQPKVPLSNFIFHLSVCVLKKQCFGSGGCKDIDHNTSI